ncbi:hypothetical protein PAHAL_5G453600 [Panicum hallii]|uniref:Uncharacterized protein n=1 Tax=Panicum hallii TaxID=206008 RepID=A0A2T8INE0_9POAL|nr:hypothetical protein PAHAL_5G453600 [Panicum hallii]
MASPQESNSVCLKRKLVDDCLSKDCKSRRVKSENGPSFDSSAKRCNCCCTRPNLANDCANFLKSGAPSRIMYYKQGSWHNFPEQIMKSLIEEFRGNKSSVVSVMDDEPILVDFLSMTLVNLKTRKQRSVACDELAKGNSGNADSTAQGIMVDKVASSPPEVVKQVVLESSPPAPEKPSTVDILRKKITSVERGSESFLFVQDLFLSGMGPFATPSNILHIHRYSPNDITAQCRFEAFERQMKATKEARGDANVRYGWLGSRKNDIVRILINGLGTTANPIEKAGLSAGVYLSPENRAFTSVGLCDVDEKGVQYMLLCRMILGNMEAVEPGSQESFPSSEIYDSGVDDCSNPKCFVMWPSHLSTHIRLEYLVSFKLVSKVRHYLLDLKGLWFHPSPKEAAMDISTLQPVTCETGEGPTSPWISFRVLFGVIQDNISSVAKELLFHHYEELKESIISREEMVKKMIIIVGEKILLEALKKLHYCPSLWYKPSVEAVSSHPVMAAQEQLSLDKAGGNCSLTLNVNDGDSHAPMLMAPIVHDGLLRTISGNSASPGQVCKSATPIAGHSGLTSKGYESAVPSLALGNSKSTGVKRLNSAPRMTPEGQEFLSLGIASRPPHLVKLQAGLTSLPYLQFTCQHRGRDSLTLSITPKCNGGPALSQAPKRHESPIADTSTKGHDCEEKRKREEAERKAKLDAIAAKQRQREIELEEKEKARKEQLLRGSEATRVTDSAPVAQPPREPAAPAVAVAATIAPAAGKYVPKFKRGDSSSSSAGGSQRPADVRTRDEDRWGSREERPRPDVRPLRQDGPPARQDAPPARPDGPPPATDRWRGSRFSSSSSTSSSTWGGRGTDAHRLRFFLLSGTSVQNVCQRSQGTWLLEFVFFIALTAPKILELVC